MYDNLTASAAVNWSHGRSKGCISKWCWDQRRRAQVQSLGLNGPKISWFEWYFRRDSWGCGRSICNGNFETHHLIIISSLSYLFVFTCGRALCVHDEVHAGNSLGVFLILMSLTLTPIINSGGCFEKHFVTLSCCSSANPQLKGKWGLHPVWGWKRVQASDKPCAPDTNFQDTSLASFSMYHPKKTKTRVWQS